MNNAKITIVRYKKHANVTKIVTVVGVLAVLLLSISLPVRIALVMVLLLLEVRLLSRLMTHTTNVLLNKHLDPELYYAVAHGIGAVAPNGMVDITAAYYMHDYHTAYNLCLQKLEKTKATALQYWYKMMLSRMYFDTGDLEKLREVCVDFQNAFANSRALSSRYGALIKFYTMFCEGDYKACCEYYKARMEEPQYARLALVKVQIDYAYAVACYRNGDRREATMYFEKVVQSAPKLNFARIAKTYLDGIASGENVSLELPFEKSENFSPPTVSVAKPPLSKLIVAGVVLVVGLIVIVVSLYNSRPQEPLAALQAYDDTAQAILALQPINDQQDALCVYQHADDLMGIAYLEAKGEGRYQCKITLDGTEIGWRYTVEASDSNLKLSCSIFDSEQDIPQTAVVYSTFVLDEKTYYFVITSCEKHKNLGYSMYVDNPEQMQAAFEEFLAQTS